MMTVKDHDGTTRDGCGRVAVNQMSGLPNCYTLECNYASGRRINQIAQKLIIETQEIEADLAI